jgi:hypothetical protein
MLESFQLSQLPGFAKLFVALFTCLMLLVCLWAVWLYTVEKGAIDPDNLPAYLNDNEQRELPGQIEVDRAAHGAAESERSHLRDNLGLAHTHINGQTLLFFAIGLVFLFVSVKPRIKKLVFWVFALAVVAHSIGLSGEGYHWFFDDLLAASGVVILVTIIYMALLIFVDLSKTGTAKADAGRAVN